MTSKRNSKRSSGSGAHRATEKPTKNFLPYLLTAVPLGLALAWLCSPGEVEERPVATTAAAQQVKKTTNTERKLPLKLQEQAGPSHRQHEGPVCSGCPQERWKWDVARDGPEPRPVDDEHVMPMPVGEGPEKHGPTGPPIVCNTIVAGLDQLTKRADRIVIGRVIGSESSWNKAHSMIYTYYTVEVQTTLKGPKRKRVKVRVVGGKVGETEIVPSHVPEFAQGDLGIIFIIDDPTLFTSVVGAHQGFLKFSDKGPDHNGFAVVDGFGRPIYGLSLNDRFIINAKNRPQVNDQVLVKRIKELTRA